MAITFSKSLSTTNLLNAYNNNIIIFSSDNVLDSVKCVINLGGQDIEITPTPSNIFRYNFKEIIPIFINTSNFQDEILPALIVANAASHVYNDTPNSFFSQLATFTITFTDDSTEQTTATYKFLKSVEQLEQNKIGVVTGGNNLYMLSPFKQITANTYDVTYFEGYPFDISLFLDSPGLTTVLNQTNAMTFDFALGDTINRLFFSDGRITITIDDHLPLVDGLNELKITRNADIIFVNVTKIPSIQGEYVKWINQYGGWNYWLFNCMHKRNRKTKDIGTIFNDFSDVSDTTIPNINRGKTGLDTLTLISKSVSRKDSDVINGIFDSPRIYYFTGTVLTQVTNTSWLGVDIKASNNLIKNLKRDIKNYKIKIGLPERTTMKL